MSSSDFLEKIQRILLEDSILTTKEDCTTYAMDWTKVPGQASCVLFPRSTDEVAKVLKLANETGTPIVPSGGRTGLAGGAVANKREAVLSLSRMDKLFSIDTIGRTVRVQAGAITEKVHEHCADAGLIWPIDLAAKGSSQIGGNLSTNAGGVRVIRYGMARKWVTALQAVTIQGEVLELNRGLEKNNTGYDLIQLLIGSEGTLAVITEATLKLVRFPVNVMVLFFSVRDLVSINSLFEQARKGPFEIQAFEFFSAKCLGAVQTVLKRNSKLKEKGDFYVLMEIEAENHSESRDRIDNWLEDILDKDLVKDGLIAGSSQEQKEVWGLREGITESLQQLAPVKKYDIAVPVNGMISFLKAVLQLFDEKKYDLELYLFGHFGDGSPHLNLLKPQHATLEQFADENTRLEKDLFPLLKAHSGSISAEHGIGILKKNWVKYSRTSEELRIYKAIKAAFDPMGLLNPGKIID